MTIRFMNLLMLVVVAVATILRPYPTGAQPCQNLTFDIDSSSSSIVHIKQKTEKKFKGLGFLIDDKGHILTARHVVARSVNDLYKTAEVWVHNSSSGQDVPVILENTNVELDLAILKIELPSATPLRLGVPNKLEGGQPVILFKPYRKAGVPKEVKTQHDSNVYDGLKKNRLILRQSISKGHSGGPLLDCSGKVVGIVQKSKKALPVSIAYPFIFSRNVIFSGGELNFSHSVLQEIKRLRDALNDVIEMKEIETAKLEKLENMFVTSVEWKITLDQQKQKIFNEGLVVSISYAKKLRQIHPTGELVASLCFLFAQQNPKDCDYGQEAKGQIVMVVPISFKNERLSGKGERNLDRKIFKYELNKFNFVHKLSSSGDRKKYTEEDIRTITVYFFPKFDMGTGRKKGRIHKPTIKAVCQFGKSDFAKKSTCRIYGPGEVDVTTGGS